MLAARTEEAIMIGAELKARVLPAIEQWMRRHDQRN